MNAVYFKGSWQEPFSRKNTLDQDFTLLSGKKIKVPLMESSGETGVRYYEEKAFQAAALPYAGGSLELLVILPAPGAALFEAEKGLTAEKLRKVRSGLAHEEAKVFLPRFKFSADWDLVPALSALGMPQVFSYPGADFRGMDGKKELYVRKAVQKAFVEVNEEGTEAAAATAIAAAPGSALKTRAPLVFRADRPFIFLIQEARTGLILFMGRMADPGPESI